MKLSPFFSHTAPHFRTPLDLLCFSHLRWDFVTQRPQHLLTRASRDRRVFYWEEIIWHHGPHDLPRRKDGLRMHIEVVQKLPTLWVIRPHMTIGIDSESGQRILLDEFMASVFILQFNLWFYTPMALGFAAHLEPQLTIYDCMDELSAFLGAPPELVEREKQLLDNAEIVFTGGFSLYESKRRRHPNVHAFPSSIDVKHFAPDLDGRLEDPADQAGIPYPRAGFYGVIDERFDLMLFAAIARLRPEVHFIIVGPVVKIDPASLPQAHNIHYLPSKTYKELPAYLHNWDVALLPFALNDSTRFISPTKTPEYLAAGKPVVSTPIRDVVRDYGESGLVAIATTSEEFVVAIDRGLQIQSKSWRESVAVKLSKSSWDATWFGMQREILRVQDSCLLLESEQPVAAFSIGLVKESTVLVQNL